MATQSTTRKQREQATRARQASKLLKKAFDMALDENLPPSIQLNAMKLFLSKVMPDLKAIEHSGNDDAPVLHKIVREIIAADPKNGGGVSAAPDGGKI